MYENVWMNVAQEWESCQKEVYSHLIFQSDWDYHHWMNTPGTIYCARTDDSKTGMLEAPHNIRYRDECREVIYRQPLDHDELEQVISAAACDGFGGYGCDGDAHWNRELLRA